MSGGPACDERRPRAGAGRPARGSRVAVRVALVLVGLVGFAGCIIPDAGIVVQDEFLNVGAVRIVEPIPVTDRADDDCAERTILSGCPQIPDTLPSGLIRPELPLCVCPEDSFNRAGGFEIFVEDPDIDAQGDPKDELYGAILLDMPPDATDPRDYLAYTSHLPPEAPAQRFRASEVQTIERPDPHLKYWSLGDGGAVDLCNDGAAVDPGLHELRLVVTDRPWYRPLELDASGDAVRDEDGELVYHDPVFGMPDLAAGATYDTTTYVLQCFDSAAPPAGIECNCEAEQT